MMYNPELGQVFTAPAVADYMVGLFSIPKDARILDPCFGGGAFLRALAKAGRKNVVGYEIDSYWHEKTAAEFPDYRLRCCDFLRVDTSSKFSGIIMNPPYIRHEKINDLSAYGISKDRLFTDPLFCDLPKTANLYMFFILKAMDLLSEDGELIAIFPNSWMLARGGKRFRALLERSVDITEQIDFYGTVFEDNAQVEVSVLKMVKTDVRHVTNVSQMKVRHGMLAHDARDEISLSLPLPAGFHQYARVRRGITTGCNAFFINPDLDLDASSYLQPILSSPKDYTGYNTSKARFDTLLCVDESAWSNAKVGEYLEAWKMRILETGTPKTLYEKIRANKPWFELHPFPCDGILFSYFVRSDMKFTLNTSGALVRDNFYIIYPREGMDPFLLVALLNNDFTFYQLERSGKRYGDGLLKIQRYDIEALAFPDVSDFSERQIRQLTAYGRDLVDTGSPRLIEEITSVIAESLGLPFSMVKEAYENEKRSRLERVSCLM